MRILLMSALLAGTPATAFAQSWRVVAFDDETPRGASVAYADAASIERSGDEVRFLMQVRFASPPPDSDNLRSRMRVQCGARRWASEGTSLHVGDRLTHELGSTEMAEARAGTNGAVIVENICSGRFESEVVDPETHSRQLIGRK